MNYRDIHYELWAAVGPQDALLVVDLQNDFMPGGALPVPEGDTIVGGVNAVMELFSAARLPVVFTQDWHPAGHGSFASAHEGRKPFDPCVAEGLGPVLWPDHCVQGTWGADFHQDLKEGFAQAIIRKGYHGHIDSYSGIYENDRKTPTGLDGYLRERLVRRLFLCGLALDYCVFFTAADALNRGYEVYVILDLTRAVAAPEDSVSHALETLTTAGAGFIHSRVLGLRTP